MRYNNVLDAGSWLTISFTDGKYTGEKFIHGESVGTAFGNEWHQFFQRFGALGLAPGEPTKFEHFPRETGD